LNAKVTKMLNSTLKAKLAQANSAGDQIQCSIPDCYRPTMRSAGVGLAQFHCRYHVQFLARHGSHWCSSISATDLKPYLQVALRWIKKHMSQPDVARALTEIDWLLANAGRSEPAQNIKRRSAIERGRIAFARLREANVMPERLLAIHMAVSAIIADDRGSHRVPEFRIVQVAKAAHRLASGTHKRWDFPLADGRTAPIEFHVYPKSSGRVLRVIGGKLEEICAEVTEQNLQEIRDLKLERFGPHPSHLPGWRPLWARQREI